jgi:hypothetical protein
LPASLALWSTFLKPRRMLWAVIEAISMADEVFAVRVLDALHDGKPAVRQYNGITVF